MSKLDGVKYCVVQCNTTDDVFSFEKLFQSGKFVYRGQKDAAWGLQASLERDAGACKNLVAEQNAINFFRIESEKYGLLKRSQEKNIDILGRMQHYGVNTRLIDFTMEFATALLFAFHEEVSDSGERAVWVLNWRAAIENSQPVRKLLDGLSMRLMREPEFQMTVDSDGETPFDPIEYYLSFIRDSGLDASIEYAERVRDIAEQYLSVEADVGMLPLLWENYNNNPNMRAQKGVFLMPLNFRGIESNIERLFDFQMDNPVKFSLEGFDEHLQDYHLDQLYLVKIQVHNSLRGEILERLERGYGKTYDSLFPRFEKIAQMVRYE